MTTLKVTIEGAQGSGKTELARAIERYCDEKSLDCSVVDSDCIFGTNQSEPKGRIDVEIKTV